MTEPDWQTVTITVDDGRTIDFSVDEAAEGPALFALGIRKSGSSIFNNLVNALGMREGRRAIDPSDTFFQKGLRFADWNRPDVIGRLLRPGNLYIGFRDAPTAVFDEPGFRDAKKILLVRDPRDALVSEYFSSAYSHALPKEGDGGVIAEERARALKSSLEDYVVQRVQPLNATVERYAPILDDPRLLLLRYEDVILEKRAWIARIAEQFGFDPPPDYVDAMLGWADQRPEVEVPTNFVRRVTPGDHSEKLSPAVIAEVERRLSLIWTRLGYTF